MKVDENERYTTPPSIEGSSLSRVIQQRVLVLCKHWLKFVEASGETQSTSGSSSDLAARKMAREVEDVFRAFFSEKPRQDRYHEIHDLFTKCMSERVCLSSFFLYFFYLFIFYFFHL